jgi:hypothetical protein
MKGFGLENSPVTRKSLLKMAGRILGNWLDIRIVGNLIVPWG